MANTTDIQHTCGECTFYNHGYCVKTRMNGTPRYQYACHRFMTDEEYLAYRAKQHNERMERNEVRFNFMLTALEISATTTMHIMEYFDSLFADHMVERNWRFDRKRAAKDIRGAAEKMRKLYQSSFMNDLKQTMTDKETGKVWDGHKYDSHDGDARNWALKLFYDLDRCWQDPEKDKMILDAYRSLPDNNTFAQQDYNHFTSRQ